jgi:hypothetical protein
MMLSATQHQLSRDLFWSMLGVTAISCLGAVIARSILHSLEQKD